MSACRATAWAFLCLTACSSGSDTEVDSSTQPSTRPLDAGLLRDASARPATTHLDGSTPIKSPSSSPMCEPGTYSGEFTCQVSGILPWGGTITFSLVSMRVDSADVSFLTIQAGTKLEGMDTMNGTFGGDLSGMFDCDTGELTGTLANGFYDGNFGFMIKLAGSLMGQYGIEDGGLPGFTGVMGPLSNPDWGPVGPTAMCTWSAVRVGDADAGTP